MVPASPKDAVKNYTGSAIGAGIRHQLRFSGDLNQRQQLLAQQCQFL